MLVSSPNITVLTLTTANTEYSQALRLSKGYFEVACRTMADLKMAFNAGDIAAGTYKTIFAGSAYNLGGVAARVQGNLTLYFTGGTNGLVVEILEWQG